MSLIKKPTVAVYKFSSCDGCQLSLLNLEDELLSLAGVVEIAYFLEARRRTLPPPYDISLVEGSVSTPEEKERIEKIRANSGLLITIGTCATAGGIQALRNFNDKDEFANYVYAHPDYLDALDTSTAISDHVEVDLEIWGCPVNKYQVLEAIAALLQNRKPRFSNHSVCLDCKRNGFTCITIAEGIPCLGPVTRTGCGAICPGSGRGCYGCFGPAPNPALGALLPILKSTERYPGEATKLLQHISVGAPAFAQASQKAQEDI
jgi:coenzyme F420-reducing hydrogenase gamma subunit